MNAEERRVLACAWTAGVVFIALLYLTGSFIKSIIISAFVLVSTLLGVGQRLLFSNGVVVGLFAIAVLFGFVHPEHWPDLVKSTTDALRR